MATNEDCSAISPSIRFRPLAHLRIAITDFPANDTLTAALLSNVNCSEVQRSQLHRKQLPISIERLYSFTVDIRAGRKFRYSIGIWCTVARFETTDKVILQLRGISTRKQNTNTQRHYNYYYVLTPDTDAIAAPTGEGTVVVNVAKGRYRPPKFYVSTMN